MFADMSANGMSPGGEMRHTGRVRPDDPLLAIVAAVEAGVAASGDAGALIVPDAEVDILWSPGATPFIAGPDTGPSTSIIGRRAPYVRVQIKRGRATALARCDMDQLADRRVGLESLWHDPDWAVLADEADLVAGRARLLEALRRRVGTGWEPDPAIELALAGRDAGLSQRQLRRRFRRSIGYGPATLRRIERFGHVRQLADRGLPLAAAAAGAGYSDQAHLSREVKRLTGLTPTAYFD